MLIVYCETCGHRVRESDVSSGAATRVGENRFLCATCKPAGAKSPSSSKNAIPVQRAEAVPPTAEVRPPSRPMRNTSKITRDSREAPAAAENAERGRAKPRSRALLYAGATMGVALVAAAVIVLTGGKARPSRSATHAASNQPKGQRTAEPAQRTTSANKTETAGRPGGTLPAKKPPKEISLEVPPLLKPSEEIEDVRSGYASRQLEAAKTFFKDNPADPSTYKQKLTELVGSCGATQAGKEAAAILSQLKVPEKPNPAALAAGPLTPIFDGKTVDFLTGSGEGAWKVDNGALVNVPGSTLAGQSKDEFDDGEFHFKFELTGAADYLQFSVRQSPDGKYIAPFDRVEVEKLGNKPHALVFRCAGEDVTAALDGQPLKLEILGKPRRGRLHFNATGPLRIQAISLARLQPPEQKK